MQGYVQIWACAETRVLETGSWVEEHASGTLILGTSVVYWGYIGKMEKKVETTGSILGPYR